MFINHCCSIYLYFLRLKLYHSAFFLCVPPPKIFRFYHSYFSLIHLLLLVKRSSMYNSTILIADFYLVNSNKWSCSLLSLFFLYVKASILYTQLACTVWKITTVRDATRVNLLNGPLAISLTCHDCHHFFAVTYIYDFPWCLSLLNCSWYVIPEPR